MLASNKIESFSIDRSERFIFAGTILGEILLIDVENFEILRKKQLHMGTISSVVSHETDNHFCCYSLDNSLSICRYTECGNFTRIHQIDVRQIKPDRDDYDVTESISQALQYHPVNLMIAARSGNGALLEIEYSENHYDIKHCTRLHDNWDLITARYVGNSNRLLTGSNRGDLILSIFGKCIHQWNLQVLIDFNTTHWIEPLDTDQRYAIANDCGSVVFLNLENNAGNIRIGPKVTRDHLEHIHYNRHTHRLFASSFDRTVFEVDIHTGERICTIWHAPFKCRWIKTLKKDSNIMIVQCRNGGLYKISINDGKLIAHIKNTPHSLWTADIYKNALITSGDGNIVYHFYINQSNGVDSTPKFQCTQLSIASDENAYTKRLIANNQYIVLTRINGDIIIYRNNAYKTLINCGGSIRDCDLDSNRNYLYCGCEDGSIYCVDIMQSKVSFFYKITQPVWALSLNQSRRLLACAARKKQLFLFHLGDNKNPQVISMGLGFIKRIKWETDNTLLIARGGSLIRLNIHNYSENVLFTVSNTIEDFCWDSDRRYIIAISYTRNIYLCDYTTGEIIFTHGGSIDYLKGCIFIDSLPGTAKGDFVVFGRDGIPFYHRINDERILSFMPLIVE